MEPEAQSSRKNCHVGGPKCKAWSLTLQSRCYFPESTSPGAPRTPSQDEAEAGEAGRRRALPPRHGDGTPDSGSCTGRAGRAAWAQELGPGPGQGSSRTQGVMGQLGLGLSLRGSGQPGWWAEAALAPPCLPAPSPAVPSALLLAWPGLRPPPQGFAEPLIHPGRQ